MDVDNLMSLLVMELSADGLSLHHLCGLKPDVTSMNVRPDYETEGNCTLMW